MRTLNLIVMRILVLVLVAAVLVCCGGDAELPAEEQDNSAQDLDASTGNDSYTSEALDASYEGALPAASQLGLGIFELQETEYAVTAEQAASLLPLWQAIQSDSLQGDAEINAVLKQIEGALTVEQLASIAGMQLTLQDMGAWMQKQGVNLGRPEGTAAGQGPLGDLSEEDRAAMRATRQAGGGFGGEGGPFGNLSEEERESMRATAEAGGMTFPGGGGRGGPGAFRQGQLVILAEQVVELLAELAGE